MTSELAYKILEPAGKALPFVLSIPHCGTDFPADLRNRYLEELARAPDDTDWFLERLYDFAPDIGITVIYARYSRWVIDLNREPGGKALYTDGRLITDLCPTTDFEGRKIYADEAFEPDESEKARRTREYYRPYHDRIDTVIAGLRARYDNVVFWDGHSIRRNVASIRPEPFPDLILGNNEGRTAGSEYINAALETLRSGKWKVSHNDPFKGGYLTRSKGDPANGVHALQLEMSKDLYMDPTETVYDDERASIVKRHLRTVFERLIGVLMD